MNLDNPLISVIVPIYNVELYLSRCIESIINQSYFNLEIILIDDGSTDNCLKICEEYQKKDKRIKIIHKKNGGLSDARNAGLDIMKGDYVTCIDSDDFVSKYFLENLLSALKKSNCQISTSWFVNYYENDPIPNQKKISNQDINVYSKEEFYEKLLYQDGVEVSAWGKLYKSSLFKDVRYPVGKLYEDIPTTYLLIEKVDNIAVIPNIDYFYFQRRDSIAKSNFSIKKMDAINHMSQFKNFIISNYPQLEQAAICRYFSTVCNILFLIDDFEYIEQKNVLWNEIKKYRCLVIKNRKGRKKARLAALVSFCGYKFMCFIYKSMKNI